MYNGKSIMDCYKFHFKEQVVYGIREKITSENVEWWETGGIEDSRGLLYISCESENEEDLAGLFV